MADMITGLGGPAGYGENTFSSAPKAAGNNDDGSVQVDITSVFGGDGIDFFGTSYTSLYVNSNGNISFGQPNTDYQSGNLANETIPTIAPFFGDVNINNGGEIYWDLDPTAGTVTITWDGVAPYTGTGNNSFQVVLTSTGGGDFNVEFIYEQIDWTTGYSQVAQAGMTDGGANDLILDGSGDATAMADYETTDFGTGDDAGIAGFYMSGGAVSAPDGIVTGGSGADTIDATYFDADGDKVGSGGDTVAGLGGDDTITTGAGDDTIYGGGGSDTIDGGADDDTIYGDNGDFRVAQVFDWGLEGADGASVAGGITQDTGRGHGLGRLHRRRQQRPDLPRRDHRHRLRGGRRGFRQPDLAAALWQRRCRHLDHDHRLRRVQRRLRGRSRECCLPDQ